MTAHTFSPKRILLNCVGICVLSGELWTSYCTDWPYLSHVTFNVQGQVLCPDWPSIKSSLMMYVCQISVKICQLPTSNCVLRLQISLCVPHGFLEAQDGVPGFGCIQWGWWISSTFCGQKGRTMAAMLAALMPSQQVSLNGAFSN